MKAHIHANYSAKKYGGKPEDYMPIHLFIDSSKQCLADVRHRAILHSTFGVYIASQVFGEVATNSEGRKYSVRDVAEDHVLQDMGRIPTVGDWLKTMPIETWMGGPTKTKRKWNFDKDSEEDNSQLNYVD